MRALRVPQSALIQSTRLSRLIFCLGLHRLSFALGHKITVVVPRYTFPARLKPLLACVEAG